MSGTEAVQRPADLETYRKSKDRACTPGSPYLTVLVMGLSEVTQYLCSEECVFVEDLKRTQNL